MRLVWLVACMADGPVEGLHCVAYAPAALFFEPISFRRAVTRVLSAWLLSRCQVRRRSMYAFISIRMRRSPYMHPLWCTWKEFVAVVSMTQCAFAQVVSQFGKKHSHPACSGESDAVGIVVRHGLRSLTVDRLCGHPCAPPGGQRLVKVCKLRQATSATRLYDSLSFA